MVSPIPQERGDLQVEPRSQNMQLQIAAASWRIQTSDTVFSWAADRLKMLIAINRAIKKFNRD